jgi:hypothetical protein
LEGLNNRSHRPAHCPHQTSPAALICALLGEKIAKSTSKPIAIAHSQAGTGSGPPGPPHRPCSAPGPSRHLLDLDGVRYVLRHANPRSVRYVLKSRTSAGTNVLSQDMVPACCKTLCAGQRPPSGWLLSGSRLDERVEDVSRLLQQPPATPSTQPADPNCRQAAAREGVLFRLTAGKKSLISRSQFPFKEGKQ